MDTGQIFKIRAVLIGQAKAITHTNVMSGIDKQPTQLQISLTTLGFDGDEQADQRIHGGIDKAAHLYSWSHYESWRNELPRSMLFNRPGAFGENLSVDLTEHDVCIGDIWRAGTAEMQITQGRQPCWKLNLRFSVDDMAVRVQDSLRAGWYCRVLKIGSVQAGDTFQLLHRPYPTWTVARLLGLIRDRECNIDLIGEVLALPLTTSWRKLFQKRLDTSSAEDWSMRLENASQRHE